MQNGELQRVAIDKSTSKDGKTSEAIETGNFSGLGRLKVSGCSPNNSSWPVNCDYVGAIRDGLPDGLGISRMLDPNGGQNGNVYMGAMVAGKKEGFGT